MHPLLKTGFWGPILQQPWEIFVSGKSRLVKYYEPFGQIQYLADVDDAKTAWVGRL